MSGFSCPSCGPQSASNSKNITKITNGELKQVPVNVCRCGLVMEGNPLDKPTFIYGYKCPKCGPRESGVKKTVQKVPRVLCRICENIMEPWERPIKERPGRCGNCGHGSFQLAMHRKRLLRRCKRCNEVLDTNTHQIKRRGESIV